MKKRIASAILLACTLTLLVGCGQSEKKPDVTTEKPAENTTEGVNCELTSNSTKATMKESNQFHTVIQITNTYPGELKFVFDDPSIASCKIAQTIGNKHSVMFTGLKQGQTTLTVYAGVEGDDLQTAKQSLTVNVTVESNPE